MTTQTDDSNSVPEAVDEEVADGGERGADRVALLEREGDIAADYLEVLLDIADLDGDIDIDVEADRASVSIIGEGLDSLIGPGGSTLEALQELTRLAVYRETGVRSRLMLDIGGHRARRRADLAQIGKDAAERVLASGEPEKLAPMTPFERKVVHDAVTAVEGVTSESEGEEPQRRIVVRPA
jgi:spoIIIJ-associated protein